MYAYLNRAVRLLEQGYAGQEVVDTAMRLGCGLPAGPLQLLDEIGLDIVRAGLTGLHAWTGHEAYRPAALLESLTGSGLLGRKAGRGIAEAVAVAGFRTVLVARGTAPAQASREAVQASLTRSMRRGRIGPQDKRAVLGPLDGRDGHDVDIERIDAACEQGLGHPMGPFALLDTIGLDVSLAILRRLDGEFPEGGYTPPPLLEQLVARGCFGRKGGQGFRRARHARTRLRVGAPSAGRHPAQHRGQIGPTPHPQLVVGAG